MYLGGGINVMELWRDEAFEGDVLAYNQPVLEFRFRFDYF